MAITAVELFGLLPKTLATVEKAVDTIKKVQALPSKTAKTVSVVFGIAPDSLLYALADIADDVIAAAKT